MEKTNWISVKDRLPDTSKEFNESVDLLCKVGINEDIPIEKAVCWYNSLEKAWYVSSFRANSIPVTVTHWTELPD